MMTNTDEDGLIDDDDHNACCNLYGFDECCYDWLIDDGWLIMMKTIGESNEWWYDNWWLWWMNDDHGDHAW